MSEIILPEGLDEYVHDKTEEEKILLTSIGIAILRMENMLHQNGLDPFSKDEVKTLFRKIRKYVASNLLRGEDEDKLWNELIYVKIVEIIAKARGLKYDSKLGLELMGEMKRNWEPLTQQEQLDILQ